MESKTAIDGAPAAFVSSPLPPYRAPSENPPDPPKVARETGVYLRGGW
jgi:hypothetical protein